MSTATAIKLICPECRHENEAERIYCHPCGARLDRSALSARKQPRPEKREETLERVRGLFDQRQVKIRALFFRIAKMAAGAAIAAGAILSILPPEVPVLPTSSVLPAQISLDLEMLITYHRPAVLRYQEDDVNRFLASKLKTRKDNLNHPLVDFQRATLAFFNGSCRVTVERSIFGYSIYTIETCAVRIKDGNVLVTPLSGALGRTPIHPELMKFAGFLFADVVQEMSREHKLLSRVGAIEFTDKEVSVIPPL